MKKVKEPHPPKKQSTAPAAPNELKRLVRYYLGEAYTPFLLCFLTSIILHTYIPLSFLPKFISIYMGLIVWGVGLGCVYWTFRKIYTEGHQWDPLKIESHNLIVTGPYHYTRNPMFISFIIVYLSFFIFVDNFWGIISILPLIKLLNIFVIKPREVKFREAHGEVYDEYHRCTARWI
ncbi:MAG: isoprenylcysteine carboxylmethyltransferase family protein [Rhodospirillales bacterium]|nr:isoprenylcysteine carboxylmethyltransferase family protein [Rhodospirillales bacterium]MCB9965411.1 isoprenylcysteine carboxylmethyltransferase family protein [Rhodospirillales bacterium]MCB9973307.1 isoprenylcysteine carboxylmethyltransferase family protein [Rhodospirillales bacterium]MCB9973959.1 isoprenylcysteine carboxylmethyltransferase family protein [Rhodospirillales bacterium]MCB9979884.1 isoprenylcysteine carboxylmethyltransferase family protein [Rhodospirillales bacterium]